MEDAVVRLIWHPECATAIGETGISRGGQAAVGDTEQAGGEVRLADDANGTGMVREGLAYGMAGEYENG